MNNNPMYYLFSRAWKYSEGARKTIVAYWSLFFMSQMTSLFFQPLMWAAVMDIIQTRGVTRESLGDLTMFLSLTIASSLVFWSFHAPGRILEQNNAFRIRATYRKTLLKGIMGLPMEWHADHHSGDTIDRVEKGTGGLYSFSDESFEIIYSLFKLVMSLAILAYFTPTGAAIVLVMLVVTSWTTVQFDKVLIVNYKNLNRSENKISEDVHDAVNNITTVIILRVQKLVFRALSRRIDEPFDLYSRTVKLNELKWFLTDVLVSIMVVIVMVVYFWQNLDSAEKIRVGSVYLVTNYLRELSELCFRFTSLYSQLVVKKARVMNSEELTDNFRDENFTNHVLPKDWQKLEIRNLSFSYGLDGGELHLEGVDIDIHRGQTIAVIAPSGGGKSTFLKVFRDLYHPRSLDLFADGRRITHGFDGISQAISLVPQDPEIFATTILENITLGAEHPPELVRRYTDMACFTDVVAKLPKGLDSSIKEKGVNLSGGEKQRLALSRGLLASHDKDIVLLDEPTSSLDATNEMIIYSNILKGFRGKTIISSVHKLHLLPLFDRIYMFNDGQITASGNLGELLTHSPEFRSLWESYHKHKEAD